MISEVRLRSIPPGASGPPIDCAPEQVSGQRSGPAEGPGRAGGCGAGQNPGQVAV